MSSVQEIETAIAKLKPTEMRSVADWLARKVQPLDGPARLHRLRKARGIWKNRKDLPDIRTLRAEFDRRFAA